MEQIIKRYRNRDPRSERDLAACNYSKHNWFNGWFIGSTIYKATTSEEYDALQYDYELTRYFRNRSIESDCYTNEDEEEDVEYDHEEDDESEKYVFNSYQP